MSDNDETKVIEATVGPYAGKRLTVPTADADEAIADGWARDPFAPVDPDAPVPELSDEERETMLKKADKAARKLRGEPEPDETPGPGSEAPQEVPGDFEAGRAMQAGENGEYDTRAARRGPGRPRTR